MEKRRRLCALYAERLAPLAARGWLELAAPLPARLAGNGHMFYVMLPDLETRSALIAHLKGAGILGVFHYIPLHSSPAGQRFGRTGSAMIVTDDVSERLLRLPLYYEMSEQDVDLVAERIAGFFAAGGA
jgi:dTDP-4-amino-4,6-dideoxygalactose transaminase